MGIFRILSAVTKPIFFFSTIHYHIVGIRLLTAWTARTVNTICHLAHGAGFLFHQGVFYTCGYFVSNKNTNISAIKQITHDFPFPVYILLSFYLPIAESFVYIAEQKGSLASYTAVPHRLQDCLDGGAHIALNDDFAVPSRTAGREFGLELFG